MIVKSLLLRSLCAWRKLSLLATTSTPPWTPTPTIGRFLAIHTNFLLKDHPHNIHNNILINYNNKKQNHLLDSPFSLKSMVSFSSDVKDKDLSKLKEDWEEEEVKCPHCSIRFTNNEALKIVEDEIKILQTWTQEPEGYNRTAVVQIPDPTNGQKFPVVIDLHGIGGHGSLNMFGKTLEGIAVLVAPSGYERQWNVDADRSTSKTTAPDVQFILELIEVIRVGIPSANMDDVTIVGSSMGGAMVQRLLIEVPAPLPFHRVVPLYGMLNTDQYHDAQFWKSSDEETLPYDVHVEPANPGPEFFYFHGDLDTVVTYWGGPGINSNVFLGAQNALYTWARYWGETGPQLLDEAGIVLDTGLVEYSYLDGKVVHYKLPGAKHSLGTYGQTVKEMIKDIVLGM